MQPLRIFCAFTISALFALPLPGAPLLVQDHSFEDNSLNPGGWTFDLRPEWQETNGPNNNNGFEEYIVGFAANGTDHLGMALGHDVWQDLAATYQPNTRYTLTVAAGNRSGSTNPGNQSQYLLADSSGTLYATGVLDASTLPTGTFADAPPLMFDTSDAPAAIGQTIRVLLRARGAGRSHFDHIRLDAISLIPPGSAAIANSDVLDIQSDKARLTGEIQDTGTDDPTITFFWGPEDGGATTNWAWSATLPGTQSNAYSLLIANLQPMTQYFFTSRAENSSGISWAQVSGGFMTLPLPATISNLAASNIRATTATIGANITATGGEAPTVILYYGMTDEGTDSEAWPSSIDLGQQSGPISHSISGLEGGSAYFYRAKAINSAGESWASETSTFTTAILSPATIKTREAASITGNSASLRGEVTNDGNEAPTCTLYYGTSDGGTNAASWQVSLSLGTESETFSRFITGLQSETAYFYRFSAVNSAGISWTAEAGTFTTTALIPAEVIINEFHYKPADKTSPEEFIELLNAGDEPINISGWTLASAIRYTFPASTILSPGSYLVVAENPAVILSKFGVSALGPWSGNLSSSGERIELRDATGTLRDQVEYGVGFPWPTAAAGGGASAELLNPGLDNDLGGSWRASGSGGLPAMSFIPQAESNWAYQKGLQEASIPVDAWRFMAFDDSAWTTGQTPVGYGSTVSCHTVLSDMRQPDGTLNYRSVYARKTFTVPAGAIPDTLTLRVLVDDGCVVWINGNEVARIRAGAGQLPYNTTATTHVGTPTWQTLPLSNASDFLLGGSNVLAIHAFNYDSPQGRQDFAFDVELSSPEVGALTTPTPGQANGTRLPLENIPPQIRQVAHNPKTPTSGSPVTITAKMTDPDGMGHVSLLIQPVDPGAYIRLTDPAYATTWTSIPMKDDGTDGDLTAGDSIFTAIVPAEIQAHRRLVRYRLTFSDALGNTATVPYADDEQPNFAYFVYDGLPAWSGAFDPGNTPLETYSPELLGSIPVYFLIANGSDVIQSQYSGSYNKVRFQGTFVYEDTVYDHIQFRNRGEASTYVSGKNKWRFHFNRAHDLFAKDPFGEPYLRAWGSLSGDACASPWAALHRGSAGVEEALSYKIYGLAGVPSPNTHYYHFRVIRGAAETPPAGSTVSDPIGTADGQYAGDFWGLYLAIERPDGSFLDERGLPDGNVYKIEADNGDKKYQAANQSADSSDWNTFRNAHASGTPTEAWWRANLDLETYYTFHALNRLIGNVDLRYGYNHYFYHRSSDNRWVVIPWDLDMMFIAKQHQSGLIHAHKSITQQPAIALEFRNRAREILDLVASDGSPGGGQIGQLIDEFAQIVNPTGLALTWADADAAMWNKHPRTAGSSGTHSGQTNHRGNFFWTPFSDSRMGGSWTRWLRDPSYTGFADHEDSMVFFRDYATDTWPGGAWSPNNGNQLGYGYQYLAYEADDTAIPDRPTLAYSGPQGFPNNALTFTSSTFSDPQGTSTYEAHQWRVAEISGPGISGYAGGKRRYEITPTWISPELETPPGVFTLPLEATEPGKTYRVRIRHKDSTGRWSHWSEPIQFQATPPPAVLLHYWNFNKKATLLEPTQTIGGGLITSSLNAPSEIKSDDGQDFAGINARNGDSADRHLRLNFPIPSQLRIAIPTPGFTNIVVRYETRRSGKGAGTQIIEYTLDGTNHVEFARIQPEDAAPLLQTLDFREIPGANNNPSLALRIRFEQGSGGTEGNHRFDNLTVEADPQPPPARLLPMGPTFWNYPYNWSTGVTPDAPGATAVIGTPATSPRTVLLTQPISIGQLVFDAGSGQQNLLSGASITLDGNGAPAEISVANGCTATLAQPLNGPSPLHKEGPGTLHLSADSPAYSSSILLNEGTLRVDGQLPSDIHLASGTTLEGYGRAGHLTGDGALRLGPEIFSASSSSLANFAFEFTSVGLPSSTSPPAAGNALLRLVQTSPFPIPPASTYLFVNAPDLNPGDRLAGGFFVSGSNTLAPALSTTHIRLLVPGGGNTYSHRGLSYREATPADSLSWATRPATLQFGDGPVSGWVLEILKGGIPNRYEQWRNLWFDDPLERADDNVSGPLAKPYGTPHSNLIHYALGHGPQAPLDNLLPHLHLLGPPSTFSYRFRYDPSKQDLVWSVIASPDLSTWPATLFHSTTDTPPPLDAGWLSLPLPTTLPAFPDPILRMYIQLKLELLPPP